MSTAIGVGLTLLPAPAQARTNYPPEGGRGGVDGRYHVGMKPTLPSQFGTKVWQELLNEHGAKLPITGFFGPATRTAVRKFQRANDLPQTGRVNYATARMLLSDTIKREAAAAGMSANLLCGHLRAESMLDPGAVGPSGDDLGMAQIVARFAPKLREADQWNEDTAIRYMAQRDAAGQRKYGNWDLGVLSYFSPVLARRWKADGGPTTRWAKTYADRVHEGCGGIPLSRPLPNAKKRPDVKAAKAAKLTRDAVRRQIARQRKAATPSTATRHRVARGDTLWSIAAEHLGGGKHWRSLVLANQLQGKPLRVGQVLVLPR